MRNRLTRRAIAVAVSCVAALAIAVPSALAGYSRYVRDATWGPGSQSSSGSAGWDWNKVSFSNPWGGLPQMGATYVRPDTSTYEYVWSNTGSLTDLRTISYGQARCKANVGNGYNVYIYWCDTGSY